MTKTRIDLTTADGIAAYLEAHDYKELGALIFRAEDFLNELVEAGDFEEAENVRTYICGIKQAWNELTKRAA